MTCKFISSSRLCFALIATAAASVSSQAMAGTEPTIEIECVGEYIDRNGVKDGDKTTYNVILDDSDRSTIVMNGLSIPGRYGSDHSAEYTLDQNSSSIVKWCRYKDGANSYSCNVIDRRDGSFEHIFTDAVGESRITERGTCRKASDAKAF